MVLFAFFCFEGYRLLSPNTSRESFFWMLMIRGLGMGMLFIPITTLALSTLKGKEIGEGAAFTGMMRQLGGSFGIAIITTLMAKRNVVHQNDLSSHLNMYDLDVQSRVATLTQGFISKGIPANIAQQDAYKALNYAVAKQASVLSYMDVFLYIAVLFAICIPFVLMVKGNRRKGKMDLSNAH
jgi:DHA2 family multidrug resistance protein